MKWFLSIFLAFSAIFFAIFGINCIYGTIFPVKYQEEISASCQQFCVDEAVVFAVINTESHFNKNAKSGKGAVGLMQVMPSTAQGLASELGLTNFDLFQPKINILIGTKYLSQLMAKFQDLSTALCAYNAGPSTVKSWLADERYSQDGKTLQKIPYKETENYIKKFNKNLKYYSQKLK